MDNCFSKLTVYFEGPFWVGVYERQLDSRYEACKIIFGSEPKDCEVYDFILKNWAKLKFSPSIQCCLHKETKANPKRVQRLIRKELQEGVGTKAQQALKLQQEQKIQERKAYNKKKCQDADEKRYALKQKKRKAKHRGR